MRIGRTGWVLFGLGVLLALAVAWRLTVGGSLAGLSPDVADDIVRLRVGRVLAGVGVGACLAVAGVMLQALVRNPLASPDILGVGSGAALAVTISLYIASRSADGGGGSWEVVRAWHAGPALIGAFAALAIVIGLGRARRGGGIEPVTLLLVGFVVTVMCGAGIVLMQQLMPERALANARLLVGSLTDAPVGLASGLVGLALVGVGIGLWLGPSMDAASMSDDEARSVGVPLARLRAMLVIGAGVLAAGGVVLAGPVGFVGLISPHVVRLLVGANVGHRALVAGAAMAGAALVVGADGAIKAISTDAGRLPLGVVTSLVGGVVFVLLVRGGGARARTNGW